MLITAALSYGDNQFTDYDFSILCCVNKEYNNLLLYTLGRRMNANICKKKGDRYRKLNRLTESWNNWRLGVGKNCNMICYEPMSRSLCNLYCSYLEINDIIICCDFGLLNIPCVVTNVCRKYKDCDYYAYKDNVNNISVASSSPAFVLMPPRTDII